VLKEHKRNQQENAGKEAILPTSVRNARAFYCGAALFQPEGCRPTLKEPSQANGDQHGHAQYQHDAVPAGITVALEEGKLSHQGKGQRDAGVVAFTRSVGPSVSSQKTRADMVQNPAVLHALLLQTSAPVLGGSECGLARTRAEPCAFRVLPALSGFSPSMFRVRPRPRYVAPKAASANTE